MTGRFLNSFLATKILLAGFFALSSSPAIAQDTLPYHWERTGDAITPVVIDSLPPEYGADLALVVQRWNASALVESPLESVGRSGNSCPPIHGAIRFCIQNAVGQYPAAIQAFWTGDGHLLAVRNFARDSFIEAEPQNSPSGRQAVFCYLLGVSYGVPPQDPDPTNADIVDPSMQESCLDATSTPAGNEAPTPYDLSRLAAVYEHSHTNFGIRDLTRPSNAQRGTAVQVPGDLHSNLGAVTRSQNGKPVQFTRRIDGAITVVTTIIAD